MEVSVSTVKKIDISFTLPGSKSIGARAALLSALAHGRTKLANIPTCRDFHVVVEALGALGFECRLDRQAGTLEVNGTGGVLPTPGGSIFIEDNGTALRLLTAFCTLGKGMFTLDGSPRLRERPVRPLADALNSLGTSVACTGEGAPVTVEAAGLPGGETEIDCSASSQFLSGLLIAGPFSESGVKVRALNLVSRPYVDITLALMQHFGLDVSAGPDDNYQTPGRQTARAKDLVIESDASSAAYFFAAAAVCGGRVRILNLKPGSMQADMLFVSLLGGMGADLAYGDDWVEVRGTGRLTGIETDMSDYPDSVPLLAAIAPFCTSPTTIRNIPHLRHKESDRIAAIQQELERCGVTVESGPDWLTVHPSEVRGAAVQSHNDHRIAMSMSVLGLRAGGVTITGAECVEKSFPEFFDYLSRVSSNP